MKNRLKLCQRTLPSYSRGEERMNMVTHIVGGGIGIGALIVCTVRALHLGDSWDLVAALLYGLSMVTLYTMSSVYHGLRPGTAKKVLQVLDHCTIYLLIAGSYSIVALSALRRQSAALGWGLFTFEWLLAIPAVTLTAIDLKRYRVFSMICYLFMGWCILFFLPQARAALTEPGFNWLLSGGVAYTVGAVFYGIGSRKKWMHSVFHIFVVLGSVLQLISIVLFTL